MQVSGGEAAAGCLYQAKFLPAGTGSPLCEGRGGDNGAGHDERMGTGRGEEDWGQKV